MHAEFLGNGKTGNNLTTQESGICGAKIIVTHAGKDLVLSVQIWRNVDILIGSG